MPSPADKSERFLARHRGTTPLLLPNAWDPGFAKVFETLGFEAIATTSSGHAATLGRLDGGVTRDEVLAHAAAMVEAVDLPVSCDFENGFADDPETVAANMELAVATGLAGGSIEDYARRSDEPIYEIGLAAERIAAAAEVAHRGAAHYVLTARAENYLRGNPSLDDTITRLQRYQEAGADVLFAPGIRDAADIKRVVESVDLPVNVIAVPGAPTIAELGALGVGRVSVGGTFAAVAAGAVAQAARELLEQGTYGFGALANEGRTVMRAAFTSD
ncbi:MAG TPA: isocitrate lyase/phosphoenolpyruvate mutase family protein [Acidimicrobiia bacterium]|jgi:2-methylisocitrate lyase-like PEP mutase family enzyme|nr:isocitrate lyase/phosphoenolpyruvate mutase family protein [Acidimicrobiia bacterium]